MVLTPFQTDFRPTRFQTALFSDKTSFQTDFFSIDRMSCQDLLQYNLPSFDKCAEKVSMTKQPDRLHHDRLPTDYANIHVAG